ncbi:hypothetical protein AURDEDRAFT_172115 [Auricularia subglabra TFB-10046 SS5]|nr:hypothetical protein AURDEDRAFT_172115 [Auricularia subglabra TFB-10046 SS5]
MSDPVAQLQVLSPIPITGVTDPLEIAKFIVVSKIKYPDRQLLFLPDEAGATKPPAPSLLSTHGLSDKLLNAYMPDFLLTSGMAPEVCELADLLCRAWVVRWHLVPPRGPGDGPETMRWAKEAKLLVDLAADVITRNPLVWPALYQNRIFAVARLVLDLDKTWTMPQVFHQRVSQGWPDGQYKVSNMMGEEEIWYPVNNWCDRCCHGAVKACTTRTEKAIRCYPCKKIGKSCSNNPKNATNGSDSPNEDPPRQCGSKRKVDHDEPGINLPPVKRCRLETGASSDEQFPKDIHDNERLKHTALLSIIRDELNHFS